MTHRSGRDAGGCAATGILWRKRGCYGMRMGKRWDSGGRSMLACERQRGGLEPVWEDVLGDGWLS